MARGPFIQHHAAQRCQAFDDGATHAAAPGRDGVRHAGGGRARLALRNEDKVESLRRGTEGSQLFNQSSSHVVCALAHASVSFGEMPVFVPNSGSHPSVL